MSGVTVSCGMSNLPITAGNKVGFSLLQRNSNNSNSGLSMNLDATMMYKPFFAPIYGEYDGYGHIVNIVKDSNVSFLERYFKAPIEVIVDYVANGSSLYRHESLFDHYFKGVKSSFDKFGSKMEDNLKLVGFKQEKDGEFSFGDFYIILEKVELEEIGFHYYEYSYNIGTMVDNTFFHLDYLRKVTTITAFLDYFSNLTSVFPGAELSSYNALETLKTMSGMYFREDVFEGMADYIQKNEVLDDYADLWPQMITLLHALDADELSVEDKKQLLLRLSRSPLYSALTKQTSFPMQSKQEILMQDYNFLSIFHVHDVMVALNRTFQPSYCGERDGNTGAFKALNAITNKIMG